MEARPPSATAAAFPFHRKTLQPLIRSRRPASGECAAVAVAVMGVSHSGMAGMAEAEKWVDGDRRDGEPVAAGNRAASPHLRPGHR